MTVSGGEPTCQSGFAAELLRILKNEGVHTAVESNLCCSNAAMEQVLACCDLLMADLKLFGGKKHERFTGVGNEEIMRNLKQVRKPLVVRTPVVCGINDDMEEIDAIARFAAELEPLLYYELLPYHPLGLSKGAGEQARFSAPDRETMSRLADTAARSGIAVRVAGRMYP